MKTDLTITTAGGAALAAANLNGANAVTITAIAVGAGLNIISDLAGVTALQNEISRTAFVGGEGGTSGSIAGYGLFEGPSAWTAWEIGVYARAGNTGGEFLFAYAQSVNNSSGIKIPLLVKTADMPARYDFGFVFASSPAPCPAPSPVPLTLSCFAPMPMYPPHPPHPAPPPPPAEQQVWRSINTRAPVDLDSVGLPVGHVWVWETEEWTLLETRVWKQTRGGVLIYSRNSRPRGNNERIIVDTNHNLLLFSQLFFHTVAVEPENELDLSSPISISSLAFSSGNNVMIVHKSDDTIVCRYLSLQRIEIYAEVAHYHYVSRIYGFY